MILVTKGADPWLRTPVVIALNRAGEPAAHRIAAALGAPVHGRAGRVDAADAFFANALDPCARPLRRRHAR